MGAVDAAWTAAEPAKQEAIWLMLDRDQEIARMLEGPEWLHGVDAVVSGQTSERPERLNASPNLEILDSLIWAVGWNGLIQRSSDDGSQWVQQKSGTTANLWAVDFVDSLTGFAVGGEGTVLKTSDGGETWIKLPSVGANRHRSIHCLDQMRCWIAGEYRNVYFTEDGGTNWEQSKGLRDFASANVRMLSRDVGLAGGIDALWRTEDGGRSWTRTFRLHPLLSSNSTNAIYGISTADGVNVYAAGLIDGDIGILKSEDGGRTWVNQSNNVYPRGYIDLSKHPNRENHRATGVAAVGHNRAYVIATNDVILSTVDGGEYWWVQRASGDANLSLNAIAMRDGRVGWVVGNHGHVLATETGGWNWVLMRGLYFSIGLRAGELLGLELGQSAP